MASVIEGSGVQGGLSDGLAHPPTAPLDDLSTKTH